MKEHFQRLLDLLDLERECEQEENKKTLARLPVQTREYLGKSVGRLDIVDISVDEAGNPLLTLKREAPDAELTPFHSMFQGDIVQLSYPDALGLKPSEGTLYKVTDIAAQVSLHGPAPHPVPRGGCRIDLIGSDATYKRMKAALNGAISAGPEEPVAWFKDLFVGDAKPGSKSVDPFEWINPRLNEYQKEAVTMALEASDVALVHGPPGTGKTTVLVEVILQAVAQGKRVLATAPSNIAVDNIVEKLSDRGLRLVRLGHPARTLEKVRHATLDAQVLKDGARADLEEMEFQRERLLTRGSKRSKRMQLSYNEAQERQRELKALWRDIKKLRREIAKRVLNSAQVVLATHGGIKNRIAPEPFDLVVLDEASQATEPLSWIALSQGRKAVFAGDPLQLPPTLYSKEAADAGLATTLFERLQKKLPAKFSKMLRIQYRMHEKIMTFSSREFYAGKLEADAAVAAHLAKDLPEVYDDELTRHPVHFVDTVGLDYGESWDEMMESRYNKGEAALAEKLARELMRGGMVPEQIAVLSPYLAQVRRLRKTLADSGVEVGTVDAFQGREKEAVILSLVRSNEKGEVGFLSDTRRLNVALTRARRLLIVLGDSATLSRHPFYDRFLEYIDGIDAHRSAWDWTGTPSG